MVPFLCAELVSNRATVLTTLNFWQDPTGRPARPAVTDAVGRGIRAKLGLVVAASLSLHSCSCWSLLRA